MSKKLLYLNQVITIPSEEGQKRIDAALEKRKKSGGGRFDDEDGYIEEGSAAWFKNMGLKPPAHLEEEEEFEDEIDENGYMFLQNEELEYDFLDLVITLDDFSSALEHEDIGCTIFTKSGVSYHVEETVDEVYGYIITISRTWWEERKEEFKNAINKLKTIK